MANYSLYMITIHDTCIDSPKIFTYIVHVVTLINFDTYVHVYPSILQMRKDSEGFVLITRCFVRTDPSLLFPLLT